MANLLVTTTCNASCRFCFAGSLMGGTSTTTMSLERFESILRMIRDGGGDEVRLVGGEPTLHPDLSTLLTKATNHGLRVIVLSNGLMPPAAVECIAQRTPEQCSVLVNCNAALQGFRPDRLSQVLTRLGSRAVLGCTVDQIPFDIEPVVALLEAHPGLGRFLRVGMAHPVLGTRNRHLHPKQYPAVGALLARIAGRASAIGVRLVLDCGFVRCQLNDEAVEALDANRAETRFECRPIVDVAPDGRTAVHCLATASRFTMELDESLHTLRHQMAAQRRAYDAIGVYRECEACSWHTSGTCDGGCLVHRLARLEPVPERWLPKEVAP